MNSNLIIMLKDSTYRKWENSFRNYNVKRILSIKELLANSYLKRPVLITELSQISQEELSLISRNSITIVIGERRANDEISSIFEDVFCFLSEDLPENIISKLINIAYERQCIDIGDNRDELSKSQFCCALVEAIPDAIIVRNRHGDYVDIIVNKEREENLIFGSKEKMIGKNVKEVLNVRLAEDFIKKTNEVLDTNTSSHYEYDLMLEGQKHHVISYIAPIKGTDNVVWIARDITEEYKDRFYIQAINSNRIDIINNLNHEVRTPLNYVSGTLESISKLGCESFGDKLVKMKNSIDQIKAVLGNLVEFNNILQNNVTVNNKEFDLFKLVEVLSSKYIGKCYEKGLDFSTVIEENIPRFYLGDKDIIVKCLEILLDNAYKFTNDGEIDLKVRYESNNLILSVLDTGIGISKEKKNDIFYEFIQEDLSPTKHYGGIGIGLSILTGLVKIVNGKVSLKSKKSSGTRFDISIPTSAIKEREILRSNSLFINKKAVIVDDDIISRQILEISLRSFGFDVKSFTDGESVLDYLLEDYPQVDLLVVDWNIPKMDGMDIAKKIRGIKKYDECKLLLVTSFYNNDLGSLCDEVGIDSFLYKPVDNSMLNDILYSFFETGDEIKEMEVHNKYPGAKVLILDDSQLNTEMIAAYLNRIDIKADKFNDGIEAIKSVNEENYDMALIDIEMPILDGFECGRRIKKIRSDLPIIMMSAKDEEIVARKISDFGFYGFVGKPVDTNLLNKHLIEILKDYMVLDNEKYLEDRKIDFVIREIDINKVMERFHWNKELFVKSLSNFLLDYPSEKEIMKTSLIEGDYVRLKETVHKLKGHSGNLSITKLYDWCIDTESKVEMKDYHKIDLELNDIVIDLISEDIDRIKTAKCDAASSMDDRDASKLKLDLIEALKKRNVKEINKYITEIQNHSNRIFEEYEEVINCIKKYKYKDALKMIMESD